MVTSEDDSGKGPMGKQDEAPRPTLAGAACVRSRACAGLGCRPVRACCCRIAAAAGSDRKCGSRGAEGAGGERICTRTDCKAA